MVLRTNIVKESKLRNNLRNFKFKSASDANTEKNVEHRIEYKRQLFEERLQEEIENSDKKIFRSFHLSRVRKIARNKLLYNYHVVYKNLWQGDYFGGRTLLGNEDILITEIGKYNFDKPAQLSIIATTPEVIVF